MKFRIALFSIVILGGLFLSAFGAPVASQPTVKLQDTVVPETTVVVPDVTVVAPTVVVGTPGEIPVTGAGDPPTSLWTLILFGLLGLLGLAFLVALFSPRRVVHEHTDPVDTVPPHDHPHDV